MPFNRPNRIYPFIVGLLLGSLQSGLFFQLTFTMSSGFTTYLLITLCWLIGGAIGAVYVSKLKRSLRALLGIMLAAYVLCVLLVNASPFNLQFWQLYGCLIGLAGIYPGVFFVQASKLYPVRNLFFWENNGFIGGLVLTTLLFMLLGRVVLWIVPVLLAILVWLQSPISQTRIDKLKTKELTVSKSRRNRYGESV